MAARKVIKPGKKPAVARPAKAVVAKPARAAVAKPARAVVARPTKPVATRPTRPGIPDEIEDVPVESSYHTIISINYSAPEHLIISENIFTGMENSFVAKHLTMKGNTFESSHRQEPAAQTIAETAVLMGNQAESSDVSAIVVAKDMEKCANILDLQYHDFHESNAEVEKMFADESSKAAAALAARRDAARQKAIDREAAYRLRMQNEADRRAEASRIAAEQRAAKELLANRAAAQRVAVQRPIANRDMGARLLARKEAAEKAALQRAKANQAAQIRAAEKIKAEKEAKKQLAAHERAVARRAAAVRGKMVEPVPKRGTIMAKRGRR